MSAKRLALTFSVLLILLGFAIQAQDTGRGGVVFYSAREDHSNNQIYMMSRDGNQQFRLTYDKGSDVDPDLSPDGSEILFTSNQTDNGKNDVFLRDQYGVVRNLTNNPGTDEWARWSPDGKQIVFGSDRDGVFEIYVMNADGSGVNRLTDLPKLGRYPSWSPDGKSIIFRSGIDIATIPADGSGPAIPLTHEVAPSFAQMPAISHDGKDIAFMSFREGYCSVFRMTIEGQEAVNLSPKDAVDPASQWCSRAPAWSSNDREIFFMSQRPSTRGVNQIFVVNRDGTDLRQLTDAGSNGSPRTHSAGSRERDRNRDVERRVP
jgi:Tol biopolymer transport system component